MLSPEEVARLLNAAPGLKYKAALSVAYGAGLRAAEVVTLKVSDIDSKRMLIRVENGKGRKDRNVMLSPQLLECCGLVDGGTPARLAVSGPRSSAADDHPPAQSRLSYRGRGRRDQQTRVTTHVAAQLRHPSIGAEHRHSGDPSAARNGDILPANNRLKHASPTDFILASARR